MQGGGSVKKHIVCFGDSNTHGYRAIDGKRFDEEERWPCLLQRHLGDDYLVIEEGLSGRTTVFDDPLHPHLRGIDYIGGCLLSHEPVDLLIIMLGTNDTKERFSASAACIGLGMTRLVREAMTVQDCWASGHPNILIVTPQNIGRGYENTLVRPTMGGGCAEKSEGLAAEYERIAREMGCSYLDANTAISAPTNDIDYMHLTKEGHLQLADALADHIRKMKL